MRNVFYAVSLGVGGALIALAATPQQAEACGGCFAPNETVTVVTAHRMAVALSATETTLWDQIEYAGDPRDFVWVLPIQGEVLVELADNAFFDALNAATQIQLQGTFAPVQTFCPDPCFRGDFASAGSDSPPSEPDVTVYGEAVVGPYETATIGSDDPTALVTWLRDHGYAVPDSILPTIAHYVDGGLNFAVLRLAPNSGVSQMQPVRVTTPGMMPVFPLRMVAAGVEGKVGLELYVLSEGRYGAQNFEVGEIDSNRLVYDWSTTRFNYGDVFDETLAEMGGRAWIAEYAKDAPSHEYLLGNFTTYEEDGSTHSSADDYAVVTRSIPSPYLTKLRTDLLATFLDADLILEADLGGDVENFINVDNEINRPAEVVCSSTCSDPTYGSGGIGVPGAPGFSGSTRGDGLCSISLAPRAAPIGALFVLAAVGAALTVRRRQR